MPNTINPLVTAILLILMVAAGAALIVNIDTMGNLSSGANTVEMYHLDYTVTDR